MIYGGLRTIVVVGIGCRALEVAAGCDSETIAVYIVGDVYGPGRVHRLDQMEGSTQ